MGRGIAEYTRDVYKADGGTIAQWDVELAFSLKCIDFAQTVASVADTKIYFTVKEAETYTSQDPFDLQTTTSQAPGASRLGLLTVNADDADSAEGMVEKLLGQVSFEGADYSVVPRLLTLVRLNTHGLGNRASGRGGNAEELNQAARSYFCTSDGASKSMSDTANHRPSIRQRARLPLEDRRINLCFSKTN